MKTKAVRIYGKKDLRLEEFELPKIKEGEILAKVVSDSICMSSYKAAKQGTDHKRIPNDVAKNPARSSPAPPRSTTRLRRGLSWLSSGTVCSS